MELNCRCGNAARYINELGEFCCAICPLKSDLDAVRLSDVPLLLQWCRNLQFDMDTMGEEQDENVIELACIIGRGPKR